MILHVNLRYIDIDPVFVGVFQLDICVYWGDLRTTIAAIIFKCQRGHSLAAENSIVFVVQYHNAIGFYRVQDETFSHIFSFQVIC